MKPLEQLAVAGIGVVALDGLSKALEGPSTIQRLEKEAQAQAGQSTNVLTEKEASKLVEHAHDSKDRMQVHRTGDGVYDIGVRQADGRQ